MPTLHLGVIDQPYTTPAPKRRGRPAKSARVVTTGDVAGWLEDKYHVLENFYQMTEQDVVADLEKSVAGALESFMLGGPATLDPFGSASSKIEDRMKQFLTTGEMETIGYPGVPTKAALMGKSKRLKRKRGARRPSFIDSGLYQASMKAWVD